MIHFPPKEERQDHDNTEESKPEKDVPVLIDVLVSDDAELDMLPGKPNKPTHQFLIHQLVMHQCSLAVEPTRAL